MSPDLSPLDYTRPEAGRRLDSQRDPATTGSKTGPETVRPERVLHAGRQMPVAASVSGSSTETMVECWALPAHGHCKEVL